MTQEFVTLPREIVEQALEAMTAAMGAGPYKHRCSDAAEALREALEQPQGSRALTDISRDAQEAPFEAWWEKHGQFLRTGGGQYEKTFAWNAWCEAAKKSQPKGDQTEPAYLLRDLADDISVDALDLIAAIRDAGLGSYSINMMLPAKVCVAMCQKFEQPQGEQALCCESWSVNRIDDLGKIVDSSGRLIATVYGLQAEKIVACHNSHAKPKPQGEQKPVAVVDFSTEGWRKIVDALRALPDGAQLYTHPQPKTEPLIHQQIDAIAESMPGGLDGFLKGWGWRQFARAIESAHNIK